jgi:hypothetical protein
VIGAYITRETLMSASDIKATAYSGPRIDRAIEAGARRVDKLCHRGDNTRPGFGQWTGSLSFDYPNDQSARVGRLWLDEQSLLTCTALVSGTQPVPPSAVLLYPNSGPPYSRIEMDRSTAYALAMGVRSWQNSIVITGTWGFSPVTLPFGTLVGSIGTTDTTFAASAPHGVGTAILADSEWMLVTGKRVSASPGNLTADLAAANSAQTITIADSTKYAFYEEIVIDAERMMIVDIPTSTTLTVLRAYSGSTLASHTNGTAVFQYRTLVAQRGAWGTSAASHSAGTVLADQYVPEPVKALNLAYALDQYYQEGAAYARMVGEGENAQQAYGRAVGDLADEVRFAYGRSHRQRAV